MKTVIIKIITKKRLEICVYVCFCVSKYFLCAYSLNGPINSYCSYKQYVHSNVHWFAMVCISVPVSPYWARSSHSVCVERDRERVLSAPTLRSSVHGSPQRERSADRDSAGVSCMNSSQRILLDPLRSFENWRT